MFDLNKLGDMAKIANQAKQLQDKQDRAQKEQTELLRKISAQLSVITECLEGIRKDHNAA